MSNEIKYKNKSHPKHGHCSIAGVSPEYRAWAAMRARCYRVTCKPYHYYGGRGITVCDRWRESFQNFLDDMGFRPSDKHSLDRINNSGNYEPNNCRWTTQKEQMANTRRSVWIEYDGRKMIMSDWAREMQCGDDELSRDIKKQPFEQIYKRKMARIERLKSGSIR